MFFSIVRLQLRRMRQHFVRISPWTFTWLSMTMYHQAVLLLRVWNWKITSVLISRSEYFFVGLTNIHTPSSNWDKSSRTSLNKCSKVIEQSNRLFHKMKAWMKIQEKAPSEPCRMALLLTRRQRSQNKASWYYKVMNQLRNKWIRKERDYNHNGSCEAGAGFGGDRFKWNFSWTII